MIGISEFTPFATLFDDENQNFQTFIRCHNKGLFSVLKGCDLCDTHAHVCTLRTSHMHTFITTYTHMKFGEFCDCVLVANHNLIIMNDLFIYSFVFPSYTHAVYADEMQLLTTLPYLPMHALRSTQANIPCKIIEPICLFVLSQTCET